MNFFRRVELKLNYSAAANFEKPEKVHKTRKTARKQAVLWKGNHILIEFPPMVANARLRLQTDTHGCKSRGAVALANFYRKKEELHRRVYLYERDFLSALRRIHSVLQRQSPSQI